MAAASKEEELFERLGRILERHSISLTTGDVAEGLVRGLCAQVSSVSTTSSEAARGSHASSVAEGQSPPALSPQQSKLPQAAPDRPTPYQIWSAWHEPTMYQPRKPPPKLSEKGWEKLVDNLHNSESIKKKGIMHQQHQNLADELQHLSFTPELNRYSKLLACELQALPNRQNRMLKARADHLMKRREDQLQKEMAACTFSPHLEASATSSGLLKKAKKDHRSVEDFFQYEAETRSKRVERKKQLEEEESRELTFQPQLSRTSAIMFTRLKKQGRIKVDPDTRQTLPSGKRVLTNTKEDLGHEEETFTPVISGRTAQFMTTRREGLEGNTIFERLYGSGMHRTIKTHNHKVATYQERFKNFFPTRSYDKELVVEGGEKAAWVDHVQRRKAADRERADQAFLNLNERATVHVVPYTTKYMDLFLTLRPDFLTA